jgi:oxygen-independent coproporphyrinogen-3 oxidase
MSNSPISLYIHVPFCVKKCPYCSFYKTIWKDSLEDAYIKAIVKEIEAYNAYNISIDTIFIGGGTPSKLSTKSMETLLNKVHTTFHVLPTAEKTSEANPESLSQEFLDCMSSFNFNRISIGVQSTQESELKTLGRWHTIDDLHTALNKLKDQNWNFNIDLMFGLPNSTVASFKSSLLDMLNYQPNHISTYSLTIEENTPFEKRGVAPVHDTIENAQYELAIELLSQNGYNHYEVSAFTKPGKECRHNLSYWSFKPYIGLGPSASSFWNYKRYTNSSNLDAYISDPTPQLLSKSLQPESNATLQEEFLISTLRKPEGFLRADYQQHFNEDVLHRFNSTFKQLEEQGLLSIHHDRIHTTQKGFKLLNTILLEILDS